MRHVIPIDDPGDHVASEDCKCRPYLEAIKDELIVIHRYFDNREIVEEAKRIAGSVL